MQRTAILLGVAAALVLTGPAAPAVTARVPALYKNCTNFNKTYPHGVGKLRAKDKTSGTPVTTFRRSTTLYNRAMSYNSDLDRDRDKIACEKK